MPFLSPSRRIHALVVAALFLLTLMAVPSDADLATEIEKLKEERAELQKDRESQARDVDVATAAANELAAALAVLNNQVNEQEGRHAEAVAAKEVALERWAGAAQEAEKKKNEIIDLQRQVASRAVSAFVDQYGAGLPVLQGGDPNESVRMASLVATITRQEVDVAEELRIAEEDLAFEEARAAQARDEADRLEIVIASELEALTEARNRQESLAQEAEDRLEARLAEAAVMAERDQQISSEIDEKNTELQRQLELARRRRNNPAPANQPNPSFPSADEITKVGVFWVHVDIAEDIQRLLADARADGITFAGWGYRDHSAQIRLRRSHCGTSNYAIYHMPSSSCRPPTARPGRSMHEQGKAIDFTYNGRSIGTRSSPGYRWLAANASRYGLYNLPSEPWHWSTNGN